MSIEGSLTTRACMLVSGCLFLCYLFIFHDLLVSYFGYYDGAKINKQRMINVWECYMKIYSIASLHLLAASIDFETRIMYTILMLFNKVQMSFKTFTWTVHDSHVHLLLSFIYLVSQFCCLCSMAAIQCVSVLAINCVVIFHVWSGFACVLISMHCLCFGLFFLRPGFGRLFWERFADLHITIIREYKCSAIS